MALISEFGTAPMVRGMGYVLDSLIEDYDDEVLGKFGEQDVILVRGPSIAGDPQKHEFGVFARVRNEISPLTYEPPECNIYEDWARRQAADFQPTSRQQAVIASVRRALDAKLYYTDEVVNFCVKDLGVTPEQAAVGSEKVQNGQFGMDVYYARGYIDILKARAAEQLAFTQLNPTVGQKLGTVLFNDHKRTTGLVILEVSGSDGGITAVGKRGAYTVKLSCTALELLNAIDRAVERGMRKPVLLKSEAKSDIDSLLSGATASITPTKAGQG